jgi:prepilin-type N-terminal cleavage/methylation domain-containing protein
MGNFLPIWEESSRCHRRSPRKNAASLVIWRMARFLQGIVDDPRSPSRRGVTLIELVVVMAIVVIVTAIGWGSTRAYLPRFRMISAAKGLSSDLMHLRHLAISTGRETRIHFTGSPGDCTDPDADGGSWALEIGDRSSGSTSWDRLPEDALVDGTDDDQSEGVVDLGEGGNRRARRVCLRQWDPLVGPGRGNTDSIVFSSRAWLVNPDADFSSRGTIDISVVNLDAMRRGVTDEVAVRVYRTGAARMESSLGAAYPSTSVGTGTSSTAP